MVTSEILSKGHPGQPFPHTVPQLHGASKKHNSRPRPRRPLASLAGSVLMSGGGSILDSGQVERRLPLPDRWLGGLLRFLADENLPRATVDLLKEAGLDILSIAQLQPGMADTEVLQLAADEDRLLITFDRDFGALAYATSIDTPPGIVLLRFHPASPTEPGELFLKVFENQEIQLQGKMTVVERRQIRQRQLPKRG